MLAQNGAELDLNPQEHIARLIEASPADGRAEAQIFLNKAIETDNIENIVQGKFLIARSYFFQADFVNARKWYLDVLQTSDPEKNASLHLRALMGVSTSYTAQSDLENAFRYDVLALQHAERYGEPIEISNFKQNVAVTLLNAYLYDEAANTLEDIVQDPVLSDADRAWATRSLAIAYWGIGESERSLETFEQANDLLPNDPSDYEWHGVNLPYAFILAKLGKYDEAAKIIPEGLARSSHSGSQLDTCFYLSHDIMVKSGQNQLGEAIQKYADYQPLCDPEFKPDSLRFRQDVELLPSVIRAYEKSERTDEAYALMNRLLHSQKQHFENVQNSRVAIERIRLETEVADTQIRYLEQKDVLNQTIIDKQKLRFLVVGLAALIFLFATTLFGYGYVTKSRSNNALEENTRQIRQRARSAEKEVEYKDLLIQEINHRVKNNIQSIISILNIHRRQIGSTATKATIAILNDVSNRFHTLAAYQHSLEIVDGAEEISVRSLITSLAEKLLATSSSKVDLSFDIEEIQLSSEKAAPLALIVNELISNSLKHGLSKRGGKLVITVHRRDDNIYLTCRDDGLGLPDDFNNKESLGLTIIRSLTRKLNGHLNFKNLKPGTEVSIDFPYATNG